MGTMPTNGSISHRILSESLAGYPGTRTLELVFSFMAGVQGPEHPHPGTRYNVVGFPRMVSKVTEYNLALSKVKTVKEQTFHKRSTNVPQTFHKRSTNVPMSDWNEAKTFEFLPEIVLSK